MSISNHFICTNGLEYLIQTQNRGEKQDANGMSFSTKVNEKD